MKILEVLVQDRKTNDTKIGVVEARLNNFEQEINIIATAVSNIQTQMDQVHKKLEEDKAKAAARVGDINKKWVTKQKKDEGSTSGMKYGDFPTPSGSPHTLQRAATGAPSGVCPTPSGPPHTPQQTATEEEISRYPKLLRGAVMRKKKPTKADLKLTHHCSEIIQQERVVKKPTKADLKLTHHCSKI
ncbi:uncharacterized protein LOC121754940 [Salvia splendens]|uniref:uncharacterized protein LOC121754940 n=1 Tax=Salvia splendens TaxID=180675 RepID=UPI001C26B31C|nr:uncharacterized protein LOC121754940 [Salvia splendens]